MAIEELRVIAKNLLSPDVQLDRIIENFVAQEDDFSHDDWYTTDRNAANWVLDRFKDYLIYLSTQSETDATQK